MADEPLRVTKTQKKNFRARLSRRPEATPEERKAINERKRQAREDRINAGTSGGDIGSPVADVSAPGAVGAAVTGGTVRGSNVGKKTKASKASKPKATPAITSAVDPDTGETKGPDKNTRKTVGSTKTDKTSEKIVNLSVEGPVGVRLEGAGGMPVTDTSGKIQRRESLAADSAVRNPDQPLDIVEPTEEKVTRTKVNDSSPDIVAVGKYGTVRSFPSLVKVTETVMKPRSTTKGKLAVDQEVSKAGGRDHEKIMRQREEQQTESGTHSVCTDCFSAVPHHRISTEVIGRNGGVCTDCADNYK